MPQALGGLHTSKDATKFPILEVVSFYEDYLLHIGSFHLTPVRNAC